MRLSIPLMCLGLAWSLPSHALALGSGGTRISLSSGVGFTPTPQEYGDKVLLPSVAFTASGAIVSRFVDPVHHSKHVRLAPNHDSGRTRDGSGRFSWRGLSNGGTFRAAGIRQPPLGGHSRLQKHHEHRPPGDRNRLLTLAVGMQVGSHSAS